MQKRSIFRKSKYDYQLDPNSFIFRILLYHISSAFVGVNDIKYKNEFLSTFKAFGRP